MSLDVNVSFIKKTSDNHFKFIIVDTYLVDTRFVDTYLVDTYLVKVDIYPERSPIDKI
jgi:hypothetical protein